jgi:hypothetical protein
MSSLFFGKTGAVQPSGESVGNAEVVVDAPGPSEPALPEELSLSESLQNLRHIVLSFDATFHMQIGFVFRDLR